MVRTLSHENEERPAEPVLLVVGETETREARDS